MKYCKLAMNTLCASIHSPSSFQSLKAWESAIPLIQQTDKLADSDLAAHLNSSDG